MKVLKIIGLIIAILIAIPLILALFISNDFSYEKSININSSIDKVWRNTNTLEGMDKWSPWNEKDPDIKLIYEGTDGIVGAKVSWESDVEVIGNGSQTITKLDPPTRIDVALKFYTPYESEAASFVILKEINDVTQVTWGFNSEIPYPWNLLTLAMDPEEEMGGDFQKGLEKLMMICETVDTNQNIKVIETKNTIQNSEDTD